MATFKNLIRAKGSAVNIYIRVTDSSKGVDLKRKTGFVINSDHWSNSKKVVKALMVEKNNELQKDLRRQKSYIINEYNKLTASGRVASNEWLEKTIRSFLGNPQKDTDLFLNYFEYYIKSIMPSKLNLSGSKGLKQGTVKQYKTVYAKFKLFEKQSGTNLRVIDVDASKIKQFEGFLLNSERLSNGTTGRYLKYILTIIRAARNEGRRVSNDINSVKGYNEKKQYIITLSLLEQKKIHYTPMPSKQLQEAKHWLIIGCNLGQRVSDLLLLTSKNIYHDKGKSYLQLTQMKTGKTIAIPLFKPVLSVLQSNDGCFPSSMNSVTYNKLIKEVCQVAGLTHLVRGSKIVDKRKTIGYYPKNELIASHVCRRSFATNFYGQIPTAYLKDITAHSTEKQFLEYVGKAPTDSAVEVAKMMETIDY
ncbi:phage integrase SAM-like domain-containing protein [Carboxylicivirga sp. M1479]|uniref:tyrosine-type recombinase/integrase n=1 Tax=Carboxylicivirga sp. M1479 TaxID=2594476 RepID=UPI0011789CB8|nr:phage integrase SAM-like domain-containing protein [Carboxylicivirga sp. M1479]TRX72586.1 site-specific integrase [Carboxylicivirga sp. M1479]